MKTEKKITERSRSVLGRFYCNRIVTYWLYCRSVGRNSEPRINRKGFDVEDMRPCDVIEVYRRFRGTCCQLHRRGRLSIYGYYAGNGAPPFFQKYRSIENIDYHSLTEEIGSVYRPCNILSTIY